MKPTALIALLLTMSVLQTACGDDARDPAPAPPPNAQSDDDGDGVPNREDAEPADASVGTERVVTAEVQDLEKPRAGPADAGTVAGHRAPDGIATASGARFSFDGVIRPSVADAAIRAEQPGRRADLRIDDHGEFTARLSGLRRGPNRFTLTAAAPGHRSLRFEVVVTRR